MIIILFADSTKKSKGSTFFQCLFSLSYSIQVYLYMYMSICCRKKMQRVYNSIYGLRLNQSLMFVCTTGIKLM